jgi:hypothetical protein
LLSGLEFLEFSPVISQVKNKKIKNFITGIINFSHQTHAMGLGFVEKKILRILAWTLGSGLILVTWFSQ